MKFRDYRSQLEKSKEYTDAKKELKLHFALADAVLEARIEKGWTQEKLAKAIGTKQANISRIESGLANPTLDFLTKLTAVLDFEIKFSCEIDGVVEFFREPKGETSLFEFLDTIPNIQPQYNLSSEQSKTLQEEALV